MNSVLLFSILSFIEHCHGSNMYQKAAKFCFENGLTYLTISSMNFDVGFQLGNCIEPCNCVFKSPMK